VAFDAGRVELLISVMYFPNVYHTLYFIGGLCPALLGTYTKDVVIEQQTHFAKVLDISLYTVYIEITQIYKSYL